SRMNVVIVAQYKNDGRATYFIELKTSPIACGISMPPSISKTGAVETAPRTSKAKLEAAIIVASPIKQDRRDAARTPSVGAMARPKHLVQPTPNAILHGLRRAGVGHVYDVDACMVLNNWIERCSEVSAQQNRN